MGNRQNSKKTYNKLSDDELLMCFIISNGKHLKRIYVAKYNCLIEYNKDIVSVTKTDSGYSSSNIVFVSESIIKDIIVCEKLNRDIKKYKKILFKEIKQHKIIL